mmetsp:Transcript_24108/g.29688  ORF Transcript_24108/g.29688 Transcript_24108/m.29688 type:complete len:189 (+) Transcript_24108:98-664(+)
MPNVSTSCKKLLPIFLYGCSLLINDTNSFQISSIPTKSTSISVIHQRKITSIKSSNNEEEEEQGLILGDAISDSLQSLGSEAGYLAAARKRNEEAKAKLQEEVRKEEEETEAKRRAKESLGVEDNYGPGDLSGFVGFKNDGFEASAGNDETGGWGQLKNPGEGDGDDEEPKLLLFGDDDATSDSGLIL